MLRKKNRVLFRGTEMLPTRQLWIRHLHNADALRSAATVVLRHAALQTGTTPQTSVYLRSLFLIIIVTITTLAFTVSDDLLLVPKNLLGQQGLSSAKNKRIHTVRTRQTSSNP